MMDNLIILGAAPHAHEMADIVRQVSLDSSTWQLLSLPVPETQVEHARDPSKCGDGVLGTYADIARHFESQLSSNL